VNIRDLKGKYAGKRCFLIGNGPSLNVTPLERLKDEYTIGVNSIAQIFPRTTWRPWGYVVSYNVNRGPETYATFQKAIDAAQISFVGPRMRVEPMGPNVYRVPIKMYVTPDRKVRLAFWSWSCDKVICQFGSVMFMALQIVCYLGFNPIYMLGIDHTNPQEHFCDDYWAGPGPLCGLEIHKRRAEDAYGLARKMTEKRGIHIYDATIGGGLQVFPKVRLEDIL
jgi:hypothetical protein